MVIEGKIACRARVEDSGESAVFYNRKNGAPVKTRLFSAADVRESLLIAGAYGSMRWRSDVPGPRFAGAAARLRFSGVKPKRFKRFHLALDAVLGPIDDREAREIFEAFRRQRVNGA